MWAERVEMCDSREAPRPYPGTQPRWQKKADQKTCWWYFHSSLGSRGNCKYIYIYFIFSKTVIVSLQTWDCWLTKRMHEWLKYQERWRGHTCSSWSVFGSNASHSSLKWTRPEGVSFRVNHWEGTDRQTLAIQTFKKLFTEMCLKQ